MTALGALVYRVDVNRDKKVSLRIICNFGAVTERHKHIGAAGHNHLHAVAAGFVDKTPQTACHIQCYVFLVI